MTKKTVNNVENTMRERIDVRIFGALVTESKTDQGYTGIGAIQIYDPFSIHPIEIEETSGTSAFSSASDKGQGTFASHKFVKYGLYTGGGIYSPARGKMNGVTSEDLYNFDDAMINYNAIGKTVSKKHVQPIAYFRIIRNGSSNSKRYDLYFDAEYNESISFHYDVKLNTQRFIDKIKADKNISEIRGYVDERFENLFSDIEYNEIHDYKEDDHEKMSEYVVIYEVIMSNPNGNPDDDNRPRLIKDSDIGFITNERIKRFVRDYWEKVLGLSIFISRQGNVVTARERAEQLMKEMDKDGDSD